MVARRKLLGAGVLAGFLAGVAGVMLPVAATAAEQDRGEQAIVEAIDKLRTEFVKAHECGPCAAIASIRVQQNNFLKTHQKFPDFIDAGIEIWQAVYDWHVKNRQPITTTRLPDGRYGIAFMFTTVVLRPENTPNYLSFGYDAR